MMGIEEEARRLNISRRMATPSVGTPQPWVRQTDASAQKVLTEFATAAAGLTRPIPCKPIKSQQAFEMPQGMAGWCLYGTILSNGIYQEMNFNCLGLAVTTTGQLVSAWGIGRLPLSKRPVIALMAGVSTAHSLLGAKSVIPSAVMTYGATRRDASNRGGLTLTEVLVANIAAMHGKEHPQQSGAWQKAVQPRDLL